MANRSERLKWLLMRIPAGKASQRRDHYKSIVFLCSKDYAAFAFERAVALGGDLSGRPVLGAYKEGNNAIAFFSCSSSCSV